MHEYQKLAQEAWNEHRQKAWADLKIDPPSDMFEKQCVAAIESDPRIKVLGLAIREFNWHDILVGDFYNSKYGDVLLFRFRCPCGDVVTEVMALGDNWVPRLPQLLEDLSKNTYEHLRTEGFVV